MKKILLLVMLCGFLGMNAQTHPREKIKALKTAYITEQLELTPKEAEQFWPVYYTYYRADKKLRRSHRSIQCSLNEEGISKARGKEMLQQYAEVEEQRCTLRKNMIAELENILPPRKIINLNKVEDDFHKKLLLEYSSRKEQDQK